MVVEDSAVIRGMLTRILEEDSTMRVVNSASNGQMAVNAIGRLDVDVIVLDIEMPTMDGLTALPKLLAASPRSKVIMASTLTKRNAEISLRALEAGASDYLTKPSSTNELRAADGFKRELVTKVKALGAAARRTTGVARRAFAAERSQPAAAPRRSDKPSISLRDMPAAFRPEVLAVGSSTGGPQALFELLRNFASGLNVPILVTQHMPATFTTILAEHVSRQCGLDTVEARDGMPIVAGRCYIAPGDYHMTMKASGQGNVIALNQAPPENFCRPSVDVMLRSVVACHGRRVLTTILTGMGQDGLRGCEGVVAAGGVVVAQDEETSVVWGMPGAVSTAGLCSAVLPIGEIGPTIRRIALRSAA